MSYWFNGWTSSFISDDSCHLRVPTSFVVVVSLLLLCLEICCCVFWLVVVFQICRWDLHFRAAIIIIGSADNQNENVILWVKTDYVTTCFSTSPDEKSNLPADTSVLFDINDKVDKQHRPGPSGKPQLSLADMLLYLRGCSINLLP